MKSLIGEALSEGVFVAESLRNVAVDCDSGRGCKQQRWQQQLTTTTSSNTAAEANGNNGHGLDVGSVGFVVGFQNQVDHLASDFRRLRVGSYTVLNA